MAQSMRERLDAKLRAALAPVRLEIVDESHRHAGHAGAQPGGESHFHVTIVAPVFIGEGRIARQRRVLSAVAEELRDGVHALGITALAPGEDGD
jgi:BolA family transcriptional regulator, general stress-responsive regulator